MVSLVGRLGLFGIMLWITLVVATWLTDYPFSKGLLGGSHALANRFQPKELIYIRGFMTWRLGYFYLTKNLFKFRKPYAKKHV